MFDARVKVFNELAQEFIRNGSYPYEDEYNEIYKELNPVEGKPIVLPTFDDLSLEMQEFALYWIDKFVNGDENDGVEITGEHSFYLNCAWIIKVITDQFGRSTRGGGFPDFWDEDYKYFWACDIGRWGISRERYERIKSHCDLHLIESDENLSGGKDVLYVKPRGVGASWKGGSYANYNMYLVPESTTFIAADKKEYLLKDGLYSKFHTLNSFISEHCWWLKKNFTKESLSDLQYITGTNERAGRSKIITGFKSSVIGVTVDGDKEKLRGKRGNILYEEFGSFPEVDGAWLVADAGTQEYGNIFGQRRGFGTGGDSNGGIVSLKKMAYDPKPYRLLEFKDIYEERKASVCLFTPAFRNINHKDEFGNSNEEVGKKWLKDQLAILEAGTDITKVTKFNAEYPSKLSDAFKNSGVNILPIELAEQHLDFLEKTDLDRIQCTYGYLKDKGNYIGFDIDTKARPYEDWPAKDPNKEGCIAIFKKPYIYNGRVPKGLYIISVDGYTQDGVNGPSIGSIQVFEQPNKFTSYKGDCIVAWYDGRPEGFDGLGTFAKYVFYLAEFYNAEVMIENDQVGDVISYAKKNTDTKGRKLTLYLAEQPDLAFNEKIATKASMTRSFGINMTEDRKEFGLKYYQEWLVKPRGQTENGVTIYNLQTLRSRGMLKEIIGYDGTNADRLSSAVIGMYHLKDNHYESNKEASSNAKALSTLKLF